MGGLSRNCLINSKKGSIKHTETDPDTGWNTHQMLQASKGKKNTGTKKKKKKKAKEAEEKIDRDQSRTAENVRTLTLKELALRAAGSAFQNVTLCRML